MLTRWEDFTKSTYPCSIQAFQLSRSPEHSSETQAALNFRALLFDGHARALKRNQLQDGIQDSQKSSEKMLEMESFYKQWESKMPSFLLLFNEPSIFVFVFLICF